MQTPDTGWYWYWDQTTDRAMYASLLFDHGDTQSGTVILSNIMNTTDITSYFISTQEKIQILLALVKQATLMTPKNSENIALRSDALIADLSLRDGNTSSILDAPLSKI